MKVEIERNGTKLMYEGPDEGGLEMCGRIIDAVFPGKRVTSVQRSDAKDPAAGVDHVTGVTKPKRKYERHRSFNWTPDRDKILRDNFEALGPGGIGFEK